MHAVSAGRITGTAGQQNFFVGATTSAFGAGFGVDPTTSDAPTIMLAPHNIFECWSVQSTQFWNTTPNALPAAATYQRALEFVISRAQVRTIYQNVNNYGHYVHAYYCKPRRPIPSAAFATPAQFLAGAYTQQGTGAVAGGIGLTPFDFPEFVSNFKIYKVKKIFIDAGQHHVFTLTRNKPLWVNMYKDFTTAAQTGVVSTATSSYVLGGAAKFIVYEVMGAVGNDSTTKTSATVTTGPVSFDFVTQHRYEVRPVFSGQKTFFNMTSVSTTNSLTLPVPAINFDTMLVETEVAATGANA